MFYVSTTSSISTISTVSFCIVESADCCLLTCAKKKKRALDLLKVTPHHGESILPSSAQSFQDPLDLDASSLDLDNAEVKER